MHLHQCGKAQEEKDHKLKISQVTMTPNKCGIGGPKR